jgi:PAS domain S-box-containing protein
MLMTAPDPESATTAWLKGGGEMGACAKELLAPLSLLLGSLEEGLADREHTLTLAHRDRLELVHRQTLRLLKLAHTLHQLSQIEAGKTLPCFQPTELGAWTGKLAAEFRPLCTQAGLKLKVDCPPLPREIQIDRGMWEAIVCNLLSNAFKFTLAGTIKVALRLVDDQLELKVSDAGDGIPEHAMPRLFERFYRVPGTRSRTPEGVGLGLALVKELVKLHGGSLRVECVVGQGSTFTVILPTGKNQLPPVGANLRNPADGFSVQRDVYVEEAWRWLSAEGSTSLNEESQASSVTSTEGLATPQPAGQSEPAPADRRPPAEDEGENRFRRLADAMPLLIWMSGPDQKCTWFNQPWLDFVGMSLAEARSGGWTKPIHPDDLAVAEESYRFAFEARERFAGEYRLRRHDGVYRWILGQGSPVYGPAGTFTGYIGSCLDITESKNQAAALKEANLRKDEFLAMLAHELRNPLAPLRAAIEVLHQQGPTALPVASAQAIIVRQVQHLSRLVDDLLDVSRITSGRISLKKERLSLSLLINLARETSRPFLAAKEQELTIQVPAEPIYLHADPVRLTQVITNLLSNASKFSAMGGKIQLLVEKHDGEIQLRILDNGIGLSKEMLSRAFDLFSQANTSLDRTEGGLGIGLTLVKKLVELHGGSIQALSEGEGRGSEFIVHLPIDELPAGLKPPVPPKVAAPVSLRRILVVDDKVDGADSLALLFTLKGHQVETANDGPAALAAVRAFHPDIVLLDIGLPGMSGYEVAKHLQQEPARKKMLLVALTGYCQPADQLRSKQAGFDFHLVKPASPQALDSLLSLSSLKDPVPR